MSKPINEKQIRKLIEEELERKVSELKTKEPVTREEFLKAMELMDKRFQELIDTMNQRFEEVNQRFEKSDKRFQELIDTMNQKSDGGATVAQSCYWLIGAAIRNPLGKNNS
ncbi:MAG: hypothetical protein ACTSQ8_09580 [Candidatus Helarchaeota archaeon]